MPTTCAPRSPPPTTGWRGNRTPTTTATAVPLAATTSSAVTARRSRAFRGVATGRGLVGGRVVRRFNCFYDTTAEAKVAKDHSIQSVNFHARKAANGGASLRGLRLEEIGASRERKCPSLRHSSTSLGPRSVMQRDGIERAPVTIEVPRTWDERVATAPAAGIVFGFTNFRNCQCSSDTRSGQSRGSSFSSV
jgi:hypothetical protein